MVKVFSDAYLWIMTIYFSKGWVIVFGPLFIHHITKIVMITQVRILTVYWHNLFLCFWYLIFFQKVSDKPRHSFNNGEKNAKSAVRFINIVFNTDNELISSQYKYLNKVKAKITIWHDFFSVSFNFCWSHCMILLKAIIFTFFGEQYYISTFLHGCLEVYRELWQWQMTRQMLHH